MGERTIRIPIAEREIGHKMRTVVISRDQGLKALYDTQEKRISTYVFEKAKGWDLNKSKEWVATRKVIKECSEVNVDQEKEFVRLMVTFEDETTKAYEPSYGDAFILTKEMIEEEDKIMEQDKKAKEDKADVFCPNCGYSGKGKSREECPECNSKMKSKPKKETKEKSGDTGGDVKMKDVSQNLEIAKADKTKQIVYGVFLWADKADTDGDIISAEDIEKVAHGFLVEYRDIDEMHKKETLDAEIVESFIAWEDNIEYYGKMLKKGAWASAIHVNDKEVWDKVEKGEYKGFSVRISGTREPVGSTSLSGEE